MRPLLFQLEPEAAHEITTSILSNIFASPLSLIAKKFCDSIFSFEHPSLEQRIFNLAFHNPVGLAAGFDKYARLINVLPSFGFGFFEIGSITARPSNGNPKPRLYRVPEENALVNFMGLNNAGADAIAQILSQQRSSKSVLGVNIAKTNDPALNQEKGIEDYLYTFEKLAALADFITLNVSCPNTHDAKTQKTYEEPEVFAELLKSIFYSKKHNNYNIPILVKFSPLLDEKKISQLTEIALSHGIEGFVISNTSPSSSVFSQSRNQSAYLGKGGVSGKPLFIHSLKKVRLVADITERKIPIIGVGGIFSSDDVIEMMKSGAWLVQIYTSFIYEGPSIVKQINKELQFYLQTHHFDHIAQIRESTI